MELIADFFLYSTPMLVLLRRGWHSVLLIQSVKHAMCDVLRTLILAGMLAVLNIAGTTISI